jgi:diguanylate cyclase (GGDEF)-like protein
LFRYGGEEFLLCLQQADIKVAVFLTERLRKGIEKNVFKINLEPLPQVTVSFGIALLDPDVFVEESVQRADQALYKAKEQGRNCVMVWESA